MDAQRLILAALLIAVFAIQFSTSSHIGLSAGCVNDDCQTTAGSSLWAIVGSIVLCLLVALYPRPTPLAPDDETPSITRRLIALFIDWFVLVTAGASVAALPLLVTEANIVGEFRWAFAREFVRPTDAVFAAPGIVALFAITYLYFVLHARASLPTIGQFLMALRLRPIESAASNYWLYFLAMAASSGLWPIWIVLALTREDKMFWWNSSFKIKVYKIA